MNIQGDPDEKRGVTMRVTDPENGHIYFLRWESCGRFVKDCASPMNRASIIAWWLRLSDGDAANGSKADLILRAAEYIEKAFDVAMEHGIKPE